MKASLLKVACRRLVTRSLPRFYIAEQAPLEKAQASLRTPHNTFKSANFTSKPLKLKAKALFSKHSKS